MLNAERFVEDQRIARYTVKGYKSQDCSVWDRLTKGDKPSYALCVENEHEYFVVQSPILSQGRILGYDRLAFDISGQLRALCTETVRSSLMRSAEFEAVIAGASILRNDDARALFRKDGIYYQAFHMQDNAHFVTKQSEIFLMEAVMRLSRRVLLAGVSVLLLFTVAVYFFVVRHAKYELVNLEDSRRSLKEAVEEANLNPLTSAGTRRFGESFLISAFENFKKGAPSPAVLLFDIDTLKNINDVHGHSTGDQVIRAIAEAVQKSVRSGDMLLRWGGDEFVGVFDGLPNEMALEFAKKLLHTVSDLAVETDREVIRPTVSLGISYFKEDDTYFMDAINRADRAMYQSKSEGRNRANKL